MKHPADIIHDSLHDGEPFTPRKKDLPPKRGFCTVCRREQEITWAGWDVMHRNFSSWSTISVPGKEIRICDKCAWACKFAPLKRQPVLVGEHDAKLLTHSEAVDKLATGISGGEVLSFPTVGRKLLYPQMLVWGRVVSDSWGEGREWRDADVKVVKVLRALAKEGLTSSMLEDATPPRLPKSGRSLESIAHVWEWMRISEMGKSDIAFYAKIVQVSRPKKA